MRKEKASDEIPKRRFVSERELAPIVGREVKTLQKDRFFHRGPFPFYRAGRQVLYDPDECIRIIEASRSGGVRALA